jgi:DNA repair exonuclease SbcCD ATPase subunit
VHIKDKEVAFVTNTLKQNWLNEQINDYNFFKKYRLLNKQAINLLDLGIVSLRKELMSFIDDIFPIVRQKLLAKKLERENKSFSKRLYKFHLSEKRLKILNKGLDEIKVDYERFSKDREEQQGVINKLRSDIKSREQIIAYKEKELSKLNNGVCPILQDKCSKLENDLEKIRKERNTEIDKIEQEIAGLTQAIESEKESIEYYDATLESIREKEARARECLLKLKESFKFKDYCYTEKDIKLYEFAIKVLDDFAGWYIQNWLDNLTFIINDLLKSIDLSVSFSADKQFITITDDGQEMDYEQLSSGQQVFLNVVFKLAILLNNGINNGVVLIDEGINTLNFENLYKLIDILKTLPFQCFLIYQNISEVEGTKIIDVERKGKESIIK